MSSPSRGLAVGEALGAEAVLVGVVCPRRWVVREAEVECRLLEVEEARLMLAMEVEVEYSLLVMVAQAARLKRAREVLLVRSSAVEAAAEGLR